jgi:hypothetical protein
MLLRLRLNGAEERCDAGPQRRRLRSSFAIEPKLQRAWGEVRIDWSVFSE